MGAIGAGEAATGSPGVTWLYWALMTVSCWGLYGIFLHSGQLSMNDPVNGRYKAFLFVGIAYFLTAVLAPLVLLKVSGSDWHFPAKGMGLSLAAGIVGAAGAFFVLLAFGAKGSPAVVMSIIFSGAPIVNAIVALSLHPPEGGIGVIKPQFFLGIMLAAVGGFLVTRYKPPPSKKHGPPAKTATDEDAAKKTSTPTDSNPSDSKPSDADKEEAKDKAKEQAKEEK